MHYARRIGSRDPGGRLGEVNGLLGEPGRRDCAADSGRPTTLGGRSAGTLLGDSRPAALGGRPTALGGRPALLGDVRVAGFPGDCPSACFTGEAPGPRLRRRVASRLARLVAETGVCWDGSCSINS